MTVLNFTPVRWDRYLIGAPAGGAWKVLLASDESRFGGEGLPGGAIATRGIAHQGQPDSLMLDLPPLSALLLVRNEVDNG
jgi:1,4-alpha-glucan branching enzyme